MFEVILMLVAGALVAMVGTLFYIAEEISGIKDALKEDDIDTHLD